MLIQDTYLSVHIERNPVRDVKEMVGDFFRETAALVMVFAFLDKLIFHDHIGAWWAVATVVLASSLLSFGIGIERRRRHG
jgi:hypothetical protein